MSIFSFFGQNNNVSFYFSNLTARRKSGAQVDDITQVTFSHVPVMQYDFDL
jgi:hypothetical protein